MSLTNLERARLVLSFLLERGVTEVVTCAGARNAPLVELLAAVAADFPSEKLKCWSFFEERSAAFFALGRAVRRDSPVAVLTTSGTAAAELLPAVIEAHYQGRPLIVVTADRPSRFRGSGSPQSMDQVGLYGVHAQSLDMENDATVLTRQIGDDIRPLHLNICFEEPQSQRPTPHETMSAVNSLRGVVPLPRVRLRATVPPPPAVEGKSGDASENGVGAHRLGPPQRPDGVSPCGEDTTSVSQPMGSHPVFARAPEVPEQAPTPGTFASVPEAPLLRQPLILLGPLRPEDRPAALALAQALPGPIYAEALSGLTGEAALADRLIRFEEVAGLAFEGTPANGGQAFCDGVIRLGTVPTCRVWRDLEEKRRNVPVVNLLPVSAAWPGLARRELVFNFTMNEVPRALARASVSGLEPGGRALVELARNAAIEFERLVAAFPKSEMALVRALALKAAQPSQRVYLGNSLAVREWDAVSPGRRFADVYGHRGVNGIDGQVSSFLAWSAADPKIGDLALVGDLTAMYDLAALALTPQLAPAKRTLAVINNGGGMIFRRIFPHDLFLNRHETSFADWARMFKWNYQCVQRPEDLKFAQPAENLVLEIRPDPDETTAFQSRWTEWLRRETGA